MTITSGLMSSLTDEWATPIDFFKKLDDEFGFTLDVAADDWNHKTELYFDKISNGLTSDWGTNVCWMNPPYGREIKAWMAKACLAARQGATVVCLVPARTDTAWWHDYAMQGEIRFIRGRIKFVSRNGQGDAAPFPSAVVILKPGFIK